MISNREEGFTLVELMIVLVITGVIVTAVYSAYIVQQRTYHTQEQVAEMQQNIRAGLDMMTREIRMAGYDPASSGGAGITTANSNTFIFTFVADDDGVDNNNDSTIDEANELKTIQYDLYDAYGDGINDIGRQVGGSNKRALAEHIENIEFYYTLADGSQSLTPPTLADIRSVTIAVLARAGKRDPRYSDTRTYTTSSGTVWDPMVWDPTSGDKYRRLLLIRNVQCRNMGL